METEAWVPLPQDLPQTSGASVATTSQWQSTIGGVDAQEAYPLSAAQDAPVETDDVSWSPQCR